MWGGNNPNLFHMGSGFQTKKVRNRSKLPSWQNSLPIAKKENSLFTAGFLQKFNRDFNPGNDRIFQYLHPSPPVSNCDCCSSMDGLLPLKHHAPKPFKGIPGKTIEEWLEKNKKALESPVQFKEDPCSEINNSAREKNEVIVGKIKSTIHVVRKSSTASLNDSGYSSSGFSTPTKLWNMIKEEQVEKIDARKIISFRSDQKKRKLPLNETTEVSEEKRRRIRNLRFGHRAAYKTVHNDDFVEEKRTRTHLHKKSHERYRPIVIDGSNVAFRYVNGSVFDCQAIRVCVDHFSKMGCRDIHVVVPPIKSIKAQVKDVHILEELRREGRLVTSWCRKVSENHWVSSYDDRLILDIAKSKDGIVVSNDQFWDLYQENPEWRFVITSRTVGFRFIPGLPDTIFLPKDPFGRNGQTLDELLKY